MGSGVEPFETANTIRLLRQSHPGAFLLVEGRQDEIAIEGHCAAGECIVVGADGRDEAIEAHRILTSDGVKGVGVLVDRGLGDVVPELAPPAVCMVTDTHDMETMMVRAGAFEAVLNDRASDLKLRNFELSRGSRFIDVALGMAVGLGAVRCVSLVEGMELDFDELELGRLVGGAKFELDFNEYVRVLLARSKSRVKAGELVKRAERFKVKGEARWQVGNGHDLCELLAAGLRRAVGTHDSRELTGAIIEREIRLAFRPEMFRATAMFEAMQRWEADNAPFRLV